MTIKYFHINAFRAVNVGDDINDFQARRDALEHDRLVATGKAHDAALKDCGEGYEITSDGAGFYVAPIAASYFDKLFS